MALVVFALSISVFAQGKNPLILIPGIDRLRTSPQGHRRQGLVQTFKSKAEDLRLPLLADPSKMHDDLIATMRFAR
jgi:hypothetical protein